MKKYEIVIDYIYKNVRTGGLNPGDYLPSIRTMAQVLGISTVTVYDAYCRLEHQGVIGSSERRGFVLLDAALPEGNDVGSGVPQVFDETLPIVSELQSVHFRNTIFMNPGMVPLGAIAPKNKYFPSVELSKYLSRVIRSNPHDMNTSGLSEELMEFVAMIEKTTSQYMYQMRGIAVVDEEVCSMESTCQGILFAISATTKPGGMVAVETPSFMGIQNVLHYLRMTPLEIPVSSPDGLDIDRFEELLKSGMRPSSLVVTPNFHNPTGALMPLENRQRLVALCKSYSVAIIEDDVLGPLHYKKPVPTLKSLSPDDVIYASSFSKIMSPGYRIGWLCAGKYSESIRTRRMLGAFEMTKFSQIAIAQYLADGKMKNHLARLCRIYVKNRDLMSEAILSAFPKGTEVFLPQGGQYLWVKMPEHIIADELFFEAAEKDILLAPGTLFNRQGHYRNCLRFCYAQELTQAILDAIEYTGSLANR